MSDKRTPEEIERDIEQTRAKLGEDLDELSERLSPGHLAQKAEGQLTDLADTALGLTGNVSSTITERADAITERFARRLQDHPLPLHVLGTALGLGWLLMDASNRAAAARAASPVIVPGEGAEGVVLDSEGGVAFDSAKADIDWQQRPAGNPKIGTYLWGAAAIVVGAAVGMALPTSRVEDETPYRPPASSQPPETHVDAEPTDHLADDAFFRDHYATTFAPTGLDYSYFEDAYRFGATLHEQPAYTNRDWEAVETDARRDWEKDRETPWDEVRDAVVHAWTHVTSQR